MTLVRAALLASLALSTMPACVTGSDDDSDVVDTTQASFAQFAGVNSGECTESPYNCKFHDGDSRVANAAGGEDWAIAAGAYVRAGDGSLLVPETGRTLTFNFGQIRTIGGSPHALALTTSNASAGWYPVSHITSETSFLADVGSVTAKDPGEGKMACYQIRDSDDTSLELKKVVYNSAEPPSGHERAGDYLSLPRASGVRGANLVFSVPGFALGGATTDFFPAGAKFQRVGVPTDSGRPSIAIPLWVQNSAGEYKTQSGTMRFVYGYIAGAGEKRYGWMSLDALDVSSGCP